MAVAFRPGGVHDVWAQTTDCQACVNAAGCESQRSSCTSECRARLFSIDPKRAACLNACTETATSCIRSARETCRAGNRCP